MPKSVELLGLVYAATAYSAITDSKKHLHANAVHPITIAVQETIIEIRGSLEARDDRSIFL
jgi:hypothetical protein